MTKKVRVSLYIASLIVTGILLILLIFNEKIIKPASSHEVNQQIDTETEQVEVTENIIHKIL